MKNAFTLAGAGQRAFIKDWMARGHTAFTMAEILLSLTIIGVVAAITLPSLTGNINERTWNTQRKALYARMSQAISLMPALNGYGTLTEESAPDAGDGEDTATETFLTDGLAKVLKINNICDNEHLEDCGIVTSFTNMAGSQITMPSTLYELSSWFSHAAYLESFSTTDTKAAAFETQNGESLIAFYNQSCSTEYRSQERTDSQGQVYGFPERNMCVNFIYDLNGNKGPNTVGKDIGIMTVFNATDSVVVSPMPSSSSNANSNAKYNWYNATKACTQENSDSRVPNIDELSAMMLNSNIINLSADSGYIWSSSVFNTERAYYVSLRAGVKGAVLKTQNDLAVRCINR